MSAWAAGARIAGDRLSSRYGLVAVIIVVSAVVLVALVERSASALHAADHTLLGGVFGVVVPFAAHAVWSRVTDGGRLDAVTTPIARFGLDRRACVGGLIVTVCVGMAVLGAILSVLAVVTARGLGDPGVWRDALTSAWVGALGGAAYGSWFALGSTFGRFGGGRLVALAADWILGATVTFAALPFPRSHVRNLLGAEPVLGMSQPQAALALVTLVVAYWIVAQLRISR